MTWLGEGFPGASWGRGPHCQSSQRRLLSLRGLGVWRGLRDYVVLPPMGHSAFLSHFREEEEDKMLEAMIKKKGEAPPGALAHLNSWRAGGRLDRGLEWALQGQCVQTPSPCFAKKAVCSKAGHPTARRVGVGCPGAHREEGGVWEHFPGRVCLKRCVPP